LLARSYGLVGYLRVRTGRLQHVLLPLISDSPFVHTAAHDSLRACTNDRLWSLQASLSEHKVIESKPDNTVEDLRFHQPWTELQDFADSIDLSSADDIMHKHIPYGEPVMYPQACSKQVCTKKPSCCMLCSSCQQVCNDTTAKFVSVMQQSQVLGNFYAMLAEALRVCCSAHWLASCLSRKMM